MKRGFSLLELIVSIIVMGIVFLSIPTIIMQNSANNSAAIVQQSVMDTKTRLAIVLNAPWGCTNDPALANAATPIFGNLGNFYTRNGIQPADRRNFSNIAINAPCLATETRLDAFAGNLQLAINPGNIDGGGGGGTYTRDNIVSANMATAVQISDMTGATVGRVPANTKEITITTAAATTPATTIVLRAYSANIGDSPVIQREIW